MPRFCHKFKWKAVTSRKRQILFHYCLRKVHDRNVLHGEACFQPNITITDSFLPFFLEHRRRQNSSYLKPRFFYYFKIRVKRSFCGHVIEKKHLSARSINVKFEHFLEFISLNCILIYQLVSDPTYTQRTLILTCVAYQMRIINS